MLLLLLPLLLLVGIACYAVEVEVEVAWKIYDHCKCMVHAGDDGIVNLLLSINTKSRQRDEMDSEKNLACLTVNDRIQEPAKKEIGVGPFVFHR